MSENSNAEEGKTPVPNPDSDENTAIYGQEKADADQEKVDATGPGEGRHRPGKSRRPPAKRRPTPAPARTWPRKSPNSRTGCCASRRKWPTL